MFLDEVLGKRVRFISAAGNAAKVCLTRCQTPS